MNQLLAGALFPFVLAALWYWRRKGRGSLRFFLLVPLAMLAGATWAVVPDIPRLLGFMELYHRLAANPRCDVFFFHYTIDRIEIDTPLYLAGSFLMAASLLAAAWRELALRERGA